MAHKKLNSVVFFFLFNFSVSVFTHLDENLKLNWNCVWELSGGCTQHTCCDLFRVCVWRGIVRLDRARDSPAACRLTHTHTDLSHPGRLHHNLHCRCTRCARLAPAHEWESEFYSVLDSNGCLVCVSAIQLVRVFSSSLFCAHGCFTCCQHLDAGIYIIYKYRIAGRVCIFCTNTNTNSHYGLVDSDCNFNPGLFFEMAMRTTVLL